MVDQLRREAAIKRINVSQAIEDIKVSTIISFLGPPQALVTFPPLFCAPADIWSTIQQGQQEEKRPQMVVLFLATTYSALILFYFILFLCFLEKKQVFYFKLKEIQNSRHFVIVLICQFYPIQQLTLTKTRPILQTKHRQFPPFFLQKFISDHENEDYLLVGFPSQKSNPFREKSSCSVL